MAIVYTGERMIEHSQTEILINSALNYKRFSHNFHDNLEKMGLNLTCG